MTLRSKEPGVSALVLVTRWPVILMLAFCVACAALPGRRVRTPGVASLIPVPAQQQPRSGELGLRAPLTLNLPGNSSGELRAAVEAWSADVARETGLVVTVRRDLLPDVGAIRLRKTPGASNPEGYRLSVNSAAVSIEASGDAGLFYGLQTLRQLLPRPGERMAIRAIEITDVPRFAYRGMHLDVARHFFPIEFIKKYIDLLARYKLNTFHW